MSKGFYLILLVFFWGCRDASQGIKRIVPDTKQDFLQQYSVALNKYQIEYERRVIQNYVRRHHHVGEITSFGFFQENCRRSTSKKITTKNKIVIHGTISSIDGEVIDEYDQKKPLFIQLNASNDFIGLHAALSGKRVGEKWRFIFPSYLGYGQVGDGKDIGKNVILVAVIEIISND